ncbi:MAG: uroporphyrinogen decarboxylase [Verrucomicrobiota bacterium]
MQFNDTFLKACRNQPTDYTPIWIMRQAGRYQPEYRKVREKYSLVEICHHPDVCAEVTILPVQQLNVDAAILFSDIMIPLAPMGVDFEIKEGIGPVIANPIKSSEDVDRIREIDLSQLGFVSETVGILKRELKVPLIGFSGAPFTLASYLLEGGPSKTFIKTKTFMYTHPESWGILMRKLVDGMFLYMKLQVEKGAAALQVFDSWVGNLTPDDYRQYIQPHMKRLFESLKTLNVPVIHFGFSASHLLELIQESGGDVIGIDWKTNIAHAKARLGNKVALQGALDPVALFAPLNVLEQKVRLLMDSIPQQGHVFNLGHGILPQSNVAQVQKLVEIVHSHKRPVLLNA